jgi:hypothetical protein
MVSCMANIKRRKGIGNVCANKVLLYAWGSNKMRFFIMSHLRSN